MSENDLDILRQRLRVRQMQLAARMRQQTGPAMRDRIETALAAGDAGIAPDRRAAMDRANAIAMGQIEQAGRAQLVEDNPLGARAAVAVQGIPFVGEYADEAAGLVSTEARDRIRAAQRGMEETRPGQTTALRVGGGVLGSIPLAMAAAPRVMAQGSGILANTVRGLVAGGAAGGAEGVVSGFGAGEEGTRGRMAAERGMIGAAAGGVIGGAAPAVAAGVRSVLGRFRTSDIQTIAREFGISPDAARVVRSALDAEDFTAAQAAIQRAGGRAMLADAGDATRTLLDASMTGAPGAARIGRQAVDERAAAGGREFVEVLDRFFGRPQGVETTRAAIRRGSSGARATAYDAAYATPIDYSARAGRRLESLWARVPEAARARAARLMQLQGEQSQQVMASIGPNGAVTYSRPADVRQWDYITRALNDAAEGGEARGAMGGMTAESRALSGLAREIRDTLRGSVPEYNAALRAGADTIRQTQAVQTGAELLMPSTTREQAREAVRAMTAAERTQARQGLRSYIDDLMANTQAALTDPNMDAREAIAAWRRLSSRRAQDNIAALMGEGRAQGLAREIDRIATDFELRAAVAANSRTAVRGAVQGQAREIAGQAGILDTLTQTGSPTEAGRRLVQAMTAADPGARAAREAGLFAEITEALTRTRGEREARRIMSVVGQSIGSEPISRARAEHIARLLTSGLGGGVYQTAQQSLGSQ